MEVFLTFVNVHAYHRIETPLHNIQKLIFISLLNYDKHLKDKFAKNA